MVCYRSVADRERVGGNKVDFRVPAVSMSLAVEIASNFGYPLENVRFLLLSTYLARQWLQIDTALLRIITSTADDLSRGTNIDDIERP